MSKQIASPYSTGGGGGEYENEVAAYYFAATLLRSVPRGQDGGITTEVRFQCLYEGEPLDDLVIYSDLPVGEAKLALQIKRDLAFGEKDKTFDEVISACWETFKSPTFNLGVDRFGIVIALYSKNINEYYQSVLTWARNSVSAKDFLTRIFTKNLANKTQRSFVGLIRSKLDSCFGGSVSDEDLWNFLRSMVILHFDFQKEGSRDYTYAVEVIGHLLPPEQKDRAANLFTKLSEYAAEANRTAGSHNAETLREKLQANFALLPASDCRGDLRRLREHGDFILKDIRTDIGGLILNRSNLVAEAREMMEKASFLELVGVSGTGKSAILKALIETYQGEGFPLVLAADRISGKDWSSFASNLKLTQPLKKLLLAISGSSQPTICIDGADKIIEPEKRKVVNDLLHTIADTPLSPDGSRHWTVVVSLREENRSEVYHWLDWRKLGKPEKLEIPELTTEELKTIAEHRPRLKPLLFQDQLKPVITNPFMLSLLEKQQMLPYGEPVPSIATESEISQVWWERWIGKNSDVLGRARQISLLKLGKQAIKSPGTRLIGEEISPEALCSLESDSILTRDPDRDVYYFRHDLLEDWILCRVLNQNREELTTYLQEIGEPFGLFRTVQLLGASLLEKDDTADNWIELIEQVEQTTDLSLRWYQALLTAPLVSPRASDLLDKAESFLISEDAQRLNKLLVALRTVEIEPNFEFLPIFDGMNIPTENLMPILLSDPIPRWRIWSPFMDWLVPRLTSLPTAIRPEAVKLMEIWQLKTTVGSPYRQEIGEIALAWLKEVERI